MQAFYGEHHRTLQNQFDSERLADRIKDIIVVNELTPEHQAFISSRDLFFLTTIDHRGFPTCSHKGGTPGFVQVLDAKTLAFPSYDGNGMFLSMGNILQNNKIGMLFIDFETPHRVRLHGTASIDLTDPLLSEFPGAELIVRVSLSEAFINCPRYIHRYQRVQNSRYTPQLHCPKPPAAQWKRIDAVQDVLPERDQSIAAQNGGTLTLEEYTALLTQGQA